jgi:hypothetical protein
MTTIARRLVKLENFRFGPRESRNEPSAADLIRERRRRRLQAEGKAPEPDLPPISLFDERGRPRTIADIIRSGRFHHQNRSV